MFGRDLFQYSNSEGFIGLRELIAQRYSDKKLNIQTDNILITNGSQQGLDLLGKTLVNDGDDIVIEEPGYLGAIQAFSIYRPRFNTVALTEDGIDIKRLKSVMLSTQPKLIYTVPNFQNPSGISYSEKNRRQVTDVVQGTNTLLIEDDPYGDLRYSGVPKPTFKSLLPGNTVLLGSFSKTVIPGFRLGWIVASDKIMEKLIIAKQAADLHTSHFTQCIIFQYLKDNDIEKHIEKIKEVYGKQLKCMLESINEYFPPEVTYTHPEGGMFLWAELPGSVSSRELLDLAIKDGLYLFPEILFMLTEMRPILYD